MHSKQRYKICYCSVILRELEAFRNYFRCIWTFYETENFSYSSLHHINVFFEYENFRLPFSKKISLTILKRCKKIKLQIIRGTFLDKLRKLYLNGTLIIFASANRYSRKTVVVCPWCHPARLIHPAFILVTGLKFQSSLLTELRVGKTHQKFYKEFRGKARSRKPGQPG